MAVPTATAELCIRMDSFTNPLNLLRFANAVFVSLMLHQILNRHFCLFFYKTIHILFEKCQTDAVCFEIHFHTFPLNNNEKCSNSSSSCFFPTARPTCLFRILFFSIHLVFIFHRHTHKTPTKPLDHSPEAHVLILIPSGCFFFLPSLWWLKEIDMNNSFIATNEIL